MLIFEGILAAVAGHRRSVSHSLKSESKTITGWPCEKAWIRSLHWYYQLNRLLKLILVVLTQITLRQVVDKEKIKAIVQLTRLKITKV